MKGSPMQRNFGIGKSPAKQFEEGDYFDTRSKSPAKAATDPTKGMNAEQKAIWEKNRKDYQNSSQAVEDKLNANLKKMAGEKTDLEKELEKRKNKKSPAKQTHFGGTESEKGNVFTKKGRTQRKINRSARTEAKLTKNVNKEGFDTKKSKKLMKKYKKRLSKTSELHQNVKSGKTVVLPQSMKKQEKSDFSPISAKVIDTRKAKSPPSKGEHTKSKSPAKCPLLAAAPAIIGAVGAMKKNKE